ncbi:MAG: DMT family transporter [Candidatus Binataceae bacterium]
MSTACFGCEKEAGAFAVGARLLFVDRIRVGPYAAVAIGANLIMSVVLVQFGVMGLPLHTVGVGRGLGVVLMIAGVTLLAWY